ncbi:carbonic anhydrase [Guyanagaster necrorhizus]|uniref:Carbonic anhydrase n=1 Tax=Guyanagaster necrorhizus TaxID=856835 RepID=A0A9P8AVN2_9AGAR|nr:carbonic anhydrase [Guyanagaster necrorhizus MCA 3950]KAG7449718.1 carbonic anhydrase [Guyanagaster necrorhizus MCA 3950]
MSTPQRFVKRNEIYAATFNKGDLALPPSKKIIVVTCMDARIDPAASLGIELGEAHIIRNAGGRVEDALRSIIISQRLLGTREIAVFHHTDCGMMTFTTQELQSKIADEDGPEAANLVNRIDFLEFTKLEESVKHDVKYLQSHPLVLKDTTIIGWTYHVESGKVTQVDH